MRRGKRCVIVGYRSENEDVVSGGRRNLPAEVLSFSI